MSTAKKHKSKQDFKDSRMASAVNKLGGKIEAEDILCQWELHRAAESVSDRRKREADGFLRGIIVANNISREEAAEFFKVGRYPPKKLPNGCGVKIDTDFHKVEQLLVVANKYNVSGLVNY